MLRNHAIYLTIIFLLVVIIIGNLKYHCREDRIDIQVEETPMEVQLTECTNVQGYLLSDYDQSPSLQSANTLHEQTLVSSDYMPLDQSTKLRNWEIRREQVHIIKMIGKGAFSQVAKAIAFLNTNGTEEQITVAVKMLKKNAPESDRMDLLSELEVMKILKPHPHVIKLMGCVTNSDPLLVLIEYIPYGDLLGYLRKSRGLNDTYFKDPDVQPETNLTAEQLVRFSCQIADGMRYLSSNKIIHRDLAARNVLVGEGEECKVTDFGMARNVHQDDIYTIHSGPKINVIVRWSFGVVLYEIFTVGGSPYPGINGREIAGKLQKGYRMPKPKHVDEQLYQIMFQCWEEKPNNRPTFSQLEDTLKKLMQNMNTYVNLKEYDNNLYANVDDLFE
ncbi:Proto-oncogene tyrosine-protein kinase receptor Ret [Stylophora pistillata]|uniref:Proto-oncogene tyrosine-protein kinase receptor Ret n=1 Tax=Stylophora pistillata TaxID=50429 RepID=A0A2B4RFD4_STYPI|nr:Proto-oncogene tyrosine-protein kinase receptor Ret [Stylophora pistillata]